MILMSLMNQHYLVLLEHLEHLQHLMNQMNHLLQIHLKYQTNLMNPHYLEHLELL